MNAANEGKYRRRLKSLIERLQPSVNALTEDVHNAAGGRATGELTNAPMHLGDMGTEEYLFDLSATFLANETYLITEARDALERMDDGAYGACEWCGVQIATARLDALPFVRHLRRLCGRRREGTMPQGNLNEGRPQTPRDTLAPEGEMNEDRRTAPTTSRSSIRTAPTTRQRNARRTRRRNAGRRLGVRRLGRFQSRSRRSGRCRIAGRGRRRKSPCRRSPRRRIAATDRRPQRRRRRRHAGEQTREAALTRAPSSPITGRNSRRMPSPADVRRSFGYHGEISPPLGTTSPCSTSLNIRRSSANYWCRSGRCRSARGSRTKRRARNWRSSQPADVVGRTPKDANDGRGVPRGAVVVSRFPRRVARVEPGHPHDRPEVFGTRSCTGAKAISTTRSIGGTASASIRRSQRCTTPRRTSFG